MKAFMSKQFRTLLRKNPELVRPNVDPDTHHGALDVLLHEKEELRKKAMARATEVGATQLYPARELVDLLSHSREAKYLFSDDDSLSSSLMETTGRYIDISPDPLVCAIADTCKGMGRYSNNFLIPFDLLKQIIEHPLRTERDHLSADEVIAHAVQAKSAAYPFLKLKDFTKLHFIRKPIGAGRGLYMPHADTITSVTSGDSISLVLKTRLEWADNRESASHVRDAQRTVIDNEMRFQTAEGIVDGKCYNVYQERVYCIFPKAMIWSQVKIWVMILRKPGSDPKEQSRRLAVEQAIRNQ